jgi:hypothetical protein
MFSAQLEIRNNDKFQAEVNQPRTNWKQSLVIVSLAIAQLETNTIRPRLSSVKQQIANFEVNVEHHIAVQL